MLEGAIFPHYGYANWTSSTNDSHNGYISLEYIRIKYRPPKYANCCLFRPKHKSSRSAKDQVEGHDVNQAALDNETSTSAMWRADFIANVAILTMSHVAFQ